MLVTLTGLTLCTTAALAQDAPPPANGGTLSLSDDEKSDLLAQNTESSVEAARAGLGNGGSKAIHGEMGVMIGTHNTHSIYGTAAIPLGNNAGAVVSFESSRYGGYYGRR